MKVTFFGTSHGRPEPERRCSCTMLEICGQYYFIDMGTDIVKDLLVRGIDPKDVKGVFVTHPHSDHTDGLIPFYNLYSSYFRPAAPVILLPNMAMADVLLAWAAVTESGVYDKIQFQPVKEGLFYEDELIRVYAYPTMHCPHSYSFVVEAEGKNIFFSGDLKYTAEDFPEVLFEKEWDLIVFEQAHFSPFVTEEKLKDAKVKRVIQNHIWPYWDKDLYEVAQREHPYKYGCAHDGLEITV